jgi:hypothetical protein
MIFDFKIKLAWCTPFEISNYHFHLYLGTDSSGKFGIASDFCSIQFAIQQSNFSSFDFITNGSIRAIISDASPPDFLI